MISVNPSSVYNDYFGKSGQETVFLAKLALGSSFMDFVKWVKLNQSFVNFTESAFVINKAFVSDEELEIIVKSMCQFAGRSLSFYFNDLDNQWVLNYTPYLDDVLPIVEAVSS